MLPLKALLVWDSGASFVDGCCVVAGALLSSTSPAPLQGEKISTLAEAAGEDISKGYLFLEPNLEDAEDREGQFRVALRCCVWLTVWVCCVA